MMGFLDLRIHKGSPDLPTKLRAYLNSLLTKDKGVAQEAINNYVDHDIAKWYGVSFKLRWFFGVWIFGDTNYPSERGPVPC